MNSRRQWPRWASWRPRSRSNCLWCGNDLRTARKRNMGRCRKKHMRLVQQKLRRAVKGKEEARKELHRQNSSKVGGVVTLECLVKVCLAAPIVSSRALVRAFRDVNGLDKEFVSRPTMTSIRDAWVGYYVEMHIAECKRVVAELWGGGARRPAFMRVPAAGGHRECKRRKLLAAAAPAANARGPGSAAAGAEFPAAAGASPMPIIRAIALPHFHDEAVLRLRSLEEGRAAGATRSRSSKVQQHVAGFSPRRGCGSILLSSSLWRTSPARRSQPPWTGFCVAFAAPSRSLWARRDLASTYRHRRRHQRERESLQDLAGQGAGHAAP